MESLKIYTAITHDLTEGHTVRYVQLPLGIDEATKYFASQLKVTPHSGKGVKSLVAIIPGQHIVGLGDIDTRARHPEKMIF
jgi:hypothetical protein